MVKFIKKLIIFIIPIVIACFLLDPLFTKAIRKSQGGVIHVWDDIVEGKLDADVFICGSSRALNHFDPSILQDSLGMSVYNLGMSGQTLLMIKTRYDVALKYNKQPKLVVLNVDFNTLVKMSDLFEYNFFAPYLNEPEIKAAAKCYTGGFDFFDYNLPLVRYIGCAKEFKDGFKYLTKGTKSKDIIYARGY